jgi:MFS family permease
VSLAMSVLNLVWVYRRFRETLPPEARGRAASVSEGRTRHPLKAALALRNPAVRRVNLVAFVFALAFCAMEFALTFLTQQRFGYTPKQNGMVMGFLGVCSIITQGYIVRRLLKQMSETRVLSSGLVISSVALLAIGLAAQPWQLYVGLALIAIGSGLINPSTSGLISLYSEAHEQGRVLGIFRSLGSQARAVTPCIAGIMFWVWNSWSVFVVGAVITAACLWLGAKLPEPVKHDAPAG